MTGEEFRAALVELGWKQADLCRRIDKDKNTVSKWAGNEPPSWVSEYLGAMLAIDRLHRAFVRPPERVRPPPAEDDVSPIPDGRAARMARQLAAQAPPESVTE